MAVRLFASVLAAAVACPLLLIALAALRAGLNVEAWQRLFADSTVPKALALSIWTGVAATLLAWLLCAVVLSWVFGRAPWRRFVQSIPPLLSVPHAALAIAVVLWIAPSGWLLRLLSPWATGFTAPPPWETSQDPYGLGLVACLVLKETPFLIWAALTHLERDEISQRLQSESVLAAAMGYAPERIWWHVVWPQLWPRLFGPVFAVLAYGMAVVDMAQIAGPQRPPTLAALAWQWLLDADAQLNAQGAAAAWLLAIAIAMTAALFYMLAQRFRRRPRVASGRREPSFWQRALNWPHAWLALWAIYTLCALALLVASGYGSWPFPAVLPQYFTLGAWQQVVDSAGVVRLTLALGCASAALALAWAVAWLEWAPPHWDVAMRKLLYLPLALPGVLWVIGLHRLSLWSQIDGHWSGLLLAHTLAALPYALITLSPAYRGIDRRHDLIGQSLGHTRWQILWRVKWPMLRASLWATFAVGFSVSLAQYLSTLFIGAGRYSTVTTEAVTLASGGARNVLAAFATLQAALALAVFALAARLGRSRFHHRRL